MASLHENLLVVAEQLLSIEHVGTAGRRRAISTAYYAVFRRLASLCAAWFALPPPMDREAYDVVLHSLNHKEVLKDLGTPAARGLVGDGVVSLFKDLLSAREWADYSSETHWIADKAKNEDRLTSSEAAKFVSDARAIIAAIDALDDRASHKLAIQLAFRRR